MKTFRQFHLENPNVYEEFKKVAFSLINRGYTRLSSKFIFEIVRYNTMIETNDKYKMNNNYTPGYARMFEKDYPYYFGYFSKRNVSEKSKV